MNEILLQNGEIIQKKYINFKKNKLDNNENFNNIRIAPIFDPELKKVYITNYYGELIAINIHSKKIEWKNKNFKRIKNIIELDKNIYLINKKDQILSVNKKNGKIQWLQKKLKNKNLTKPIIYNNNILIGDKNGYIYYLNSKNGNIIKKNKIDNDKILNILTTKENKIIIQTKNGNVILIKYL